VSPHTLSPVSLGVCRLQLVPIESLAARRTWEGGALCQRKTNSNVDLNRNWPFAWQQAVGGGSAANRGQQTVGCAWEEGVASSLATHVCLLCEVQALSTHKLG
jgi:hypothetical protein